MNPAKRRQIFERLRAANPNPRSELDYRTPFELLVAVVLSAQATDKGVNKATSRLFPIANTPAAFVKLGVDGLIPYISSIGLFNTKAKNVIALSQQLLDQHAGKVPRDRAALEQLPGVGRKTANVVLNVAFGEPTIAVDTHIFRVANRTRLAVGKDPEAVEQRLADVGDARCRIELLSERGETHREPVEARLAVLLGPAEFAQRRQKPMRGALGQAERLGDLSQRTRARILGEELDDREAALGGYVGHGVERAYRQRGACDGARNAISASA